MHALGERGLDVPEGVFTLDEAEAAVWKTLAS
jgi:hypothetical protein